MTKQEQAEQAKKRVEAAKTLRDQGLMYREIAEKLCVPISVVSNYINHGTSGRYHKKGQCRQNRYQKWLGANCPCGNPAIDWFRGGPICEECLNPEIKISIDYQRCHQAGNLAQAIELSHL